MNRSELVIPFFKILLNKPSVILKSLLHAVNNDVRKNHVCSKYGLNNGLPVIDLLDLFPGFHTDISAYTYLKGTSTTIDIAILKSLASSFNDCSYLEIGTWRGESIVNISDVAKECVSLSLSNKEMKEKGFPQKMIDVQRLFSKEKKNITHIEHNSMTFDFGSLNKKFDLIFVDGDHEYEAVKSDTRNVFKLLKNEKSIIVWHDYGSSYESINWSVLAGILDGTDQQQHKHLYHISNTLCAIYTQKAFATTTLEYPTIPNKSFHVSIHAEKL